MTDTRTSEALSDVDWLRGLLPGHKVGPDDRDTFHNIADALADLSHLCANYKAEIESTNDRTAEYFFTLNQAKALGFSTVSKAMLAFVEQRAEIATKDERIRQLEALVGEAVVWWDGTGVQSWKNWLARAKALAVPQEGKK